MDFTVTYDVAVIGGGIAGVAAALQAARTGKKTVLVEKNILLGGLATSGLVYIYLPICDGNGHQTCYGITEELLRNSLQLGPGKIPEAWNNVQNAPEAKRFCCRFAPAAFMLSMEELLLKDGVDLWLDTLVCDTVCQDGNITAAIVQNESGRGEIKAACFIDASGSSILARRSGLPCVVEDNYLTIWAMEYALGTKSELGENVRVFAYTGAALNEPHQIILPQAMRERMYPGATDAEVKDKVTYRGLTGKTVTDFVLETHKMAREHFIMKQEKGQAPTDAYALKLPLMPQFRKTYCLAADYILKTGENNKTFEDSIGMLPDWRKAGPVWEVPYRSLYTSKMGNLLAAGRCTGASGDAWEITRVIPSAGLTGQAAGMAAAMAVEQHRDVRDLEVTELQDRLCQQGFKLHLPDIGL